MNPTRIEHVNVTVTDPQATARRLCELFDWRIRWEGPAKDDGYTVHVGSDDDYVAVYSVGDASERPKSQHVAHLNHIGVVVDDLDAIERRVVAAGYEPHSHADYDPGRRFYFDDADGIEFEVVSYV